MIQKSQFYPSIQRALSLWVLGEEGLLVVVLLPSFLDVDSSGLSWCPLASSLSCQPGREPVAALLWVRICVLCSCPLHTASAGGCEGPGFPYPKGLCSVAHSRRPQWQRLKQDLPLRSSGILKGSTPGTLGCLSVVSPVWSLLRSLQGSYCSTSDSPCSRQGKGKDSRLRQPPLKELSWKPHLMACTVLYSQPSTREVRVLLGELGTCHLHWHCCPRGKKKGHTCLFPLLSTWSPSIAASVCQTAWRAEVEGDCIIQNVLITSPLLLPL